VDKAAARQIGWCIEGTVAIEKPLAADRHNLLRQQQHGPVSEFCPRTEHDGDIGFIRELALHSLRRDDLDVHVGIDQPKGMHARDEPERGEGIVGVQPDRWPLYFASQPPCKLIDFANASCGDIEQPLARRRQLDAAMLPLQQADAQLLLYSADLVADGGLSQTQQAGCRGEAPRSAYFGKNTQPPEIDATLCHK
jgi:hypothetical protein